MVTTLKKLISFRTIHQPENKKEFDRAFNYLISTLKKLGVDHKLVNSRGYKTLIAGAKNKPKIVLLTHIDVVPGENSLFSPTIKQNKLFGRGAFDMKFAIAAGLNLFKRNPETKKIFSLVVTSDEEIGGKNGTKYLVDTLKYNGDCFVVPDGGNDFNLEKEAKGVLHLKIISQGKSSHGSQPWEGKNAFDNFLSKYQQLRKYFPLATKETWKSTLNLGKISGGKATNSVCDYLEAYLDFRYPQKEKRSHILNLVKKIFKGKEFKIEILAQGDPFLSNANNSYVKNWIKISKKILKRKIAFTKSYGASDVRFLTKLKVPVIITRPKGGGHHSPNEWLDLKSLEKFYLILEKFVKRYLD